MTHKEYWRRFAVDRHGELLQRVGDLPANVALLPRRLRRFGSWAELMASYEAKPVGPAKVLAFVRPPPERQPSP